VAVRSAAEVYAWLTGAGFSPESATTMVAIAQAESSMRDDALGDVKIQDSIWGPSYGLFQVRTLKQQTGTGGVRDISALTDPAKQAAAAYSISNKGTDFSPWSAYTNGSYKKFLGLAEASGSTNAINASSLNPSDWASGAIESAKKIMLEGVFVVLGLALVGAGIAKAVTSTDGYKQGKKKVQDGAATGLSVAVPASAPAVAAAREKAN